MTYEVNTHEIRDSIHLDSGLYNTACIPPEGVILWVPKCRAQSYCVDAKKMQLISVCSSDFINTHFSVPRWTFKDKFY